MDIDSSKLAAMIGSRICHDLINPVGAISNGIELLEMTGQAGPEIALLSESAACASARIRLFRIAFGYGARGQTVSTSEITEILANNYGGGRHSVVWELTQPVPRSRIKLALLGLLCLESGLSAGGRIDVTGDEDQILLSAEGRYVSTGSPPWQLLRGETPEAEIASSEVHFLLLRLGLDADGVDCHLESSENRIKMLLRFA